MKIFPPKKEKYKIIIGFILVFFGAIALLIPLVPGWGLILLGLELLGLRLLLWDKIKLRKSNKENLK